jgi:hypothetical protein
MCAAARKILADSQNFELFSRKFSGKQTESGELGFFRGNFSPKQTNFREEKTSFSTDLNCA